MSLPKPEASGLPGWARGYELERLRDYARVFREADAGYALGAFTGYRERDVAADLEARRLHAVYGGPRLDEPVACMVLEVLERRRVIRDFTGEARATMEPGDVYVSRVAAVPGAWPQGRGMLEDWADWCAANGRRLFAAVWQESPEARNWLGSRAFELVAVKIPASSELIGVYCLGDPADPVPLPEPEEWGLRRLAVEVTPKMLVAANAALARVGAYADHYSSYNKGHAWKALALRGYGPPDMIEKPAEMSKAWKREHPELLDAVCADTDLRAELPEFEELIRRVPGPHQRIRLMSLDPGGGELTRHADIVDREAGTRAGHVLRVHLPLVSSPKCAFTSWTLDGQPYVRHMAPGTAWYLDTRKPHTAVNEGTVPRIHLVIDTFSTPELLTLLEKGGDL